LVGGLDETLGLEAALADFALRTIAAGMVHVAADDVLVLDPGPGPSGGRDLAGESAVPLMSRVRETFASDEQGRLHRAIAIGRVALRRLSVTIDGRALVPTVGGTQTYILELIMALARAQQVELRVLVPPDLSGRASDALTSFADVELLSHEQAVDHPRLTDVVHRPQPIFTADDLALLRLVGERVVIGQQDLIAYHNYSYHRDVDSWRAYRRTTRLALGAADQVIFFSEHARGDALGEDLLPERRTHVVGVGAESIEMTSTPGTPPAGVHGDESFLLCLGADYAHKNRPFAIMLLARLRELGWSGRLVLAGAHVPFGSSREHERVLLDGDPELGRLVIDLGPVDEPVKQWLFRHARALAYPTIYEGLGLLPLEAARMDLPCLFAAQASLSELAGSAATLVPWDAEESAAAVLPLLQEGAARESHLEDLRSLPVPSWDAVAGQLFAVYERAVSEPPPEAAPRGWQELDREAYIARLEREVDHHTGVAQEYQDAYHALEGRVGDALPLVDEDGLLSRAQQRGLMRIAGRPRLGAVLLAPFGFVGRVEAAPGDESSDDAREA
jgi:glycosyltransferase involved in cell wall biosynthesis